ncbi:hypothetical protein [Clostridium manihotivorum]|uniref:Uncharacterized protein n=1 Tax=Clostridium manihotivorum TaxID=2320868 RepID=A0A410DWY9_9CLOT|nr:hypothetical protein [Clostridium manihotivorum]QAA33540.1 hypothetical protein C1I91_18875 [Clostridium manihotivorum]
MSFEKAFCENLGRAVTPYEIREMYLDEDSEHYMKKDLSFKCLDKDCRAELVPVGVYKQRRSKRAIHFRAKSVKEHTCLAHKGEEVGKSGTKTGDDDPFKMTRYPSELILTDYKGKSKNKITIPWTDEEIDEDMKNPSTHGDGSTSEWTKFGSKSFEHIVDCYENGDKEILNNMDFTLGDKTKKFYKIFKNIKYFYDEKGLIYYGQVGSVKKYGDNYKIFFKDKAWVEKYMPVSIYISSELINRYGKRKVFRDDMEYIINNKDKEVFCYFVGAYPEPSTYEHNGKKVESYQVNIENLRYLELRFE